MNHRTVLLFVVMPALAVLACGDSGASTQVDADVSAADTKPDVAPDSFDLDAVETAPELPDLEVADTSAADTTADTHDVADSDTGPTPCPPGTADCESLQWAEVEPFPHASDHHVTFVHSSDAGTYLYVAGGATSKQPALDIWSEVWRARIADNHLLGAWEAEAPLPGPLAFDGLAQSDVAVYLVSGVSEDADGPAATNVAYIGRFDDDGHLAWSTTTPLPVAVRVHPSASFLYGTGGERPDRVVIVGGTSDVPLATVIYAEVQPSGELGLWRDGPDLPAPLTHHAAVVKNGRIWLFGGLTTDNATVPTILRSTHSASGGLKGWEAAGTLDDPPWTHAASLYADGVFLVGGGRGGPGQERYIDRMRFARWDADGELGSFIDVVNPLPVARSHVHQTPIQDGYLYSVGGRVMPSGNSIARAFVGYLAF